MSLSSALAEAYASAPTAVTVLATLEFRHPSFVDDTGANICIRVVADRDDLVATLEADAPLNAGEAVTFIACPFSYSYPEQVGGSASPEIEIAIDNVSHLLMPHLDAAVETFVPIEVTLRTYASNDLSAPGRPPVTLILRRPSGTPLRVTARAGFADFSNQRFPSVEYTLERFPTLA